MRVCVCVCARAVPCVDLKRCVSALHLDTLNKQRAALLVRAFTTGRLKEMRPECISVKVMA